MFPFVDPLWQIRGLRLDSPTLPAPIETIIRGPKPLIGGITVYDGVSSDVQLPTSSSHPEHRKRKPLVFRTNEIKAEVSEFTDLFL